MHEQSETTQTPDGRWVNVYGRKTPTAGQPLPLRYPYESESYPTVGTASAAAARRSRDEGRQQYDPAVMPQGYAEGGFVGNPPPLPPDDSTPEDAPPSPMPQGWVPPSDTPKVDPSEDPAAQLIRLHLIRNHGRVDDAAAAALAERFDHPNDPTRRNAEHALFSQMLMNRLGPLGPLMTPLYSGAKALAQAAPAGVGQAIDRVSPLPLASATRPSLSEVKWGLSPLWNGVNSLAPSKDQ